MQTSHGKEIPVADAWFWLVVSNGQQAYLLASLSLVCVAGIFMASNRGGWHVWDAGGIGSAKNFSVLLEHGITHVVNASPVVPCFHKTRLKYKVFEVYDDEEDDIRQYFEECNQFIDKVRYVLRKILVRNLRRPWQ